VNDTIVSRLAGLVPNSCVFDGVQCGPQLTQFTLVTVEEVVKQLNTASQIVAHGLHANVCIMSGPVPGTIKLAQVSTTSQKDGNGRQRSSTFQTHIQLEQYCGVSQGSVIGLFYVAYMSLVACIENTFGVFLIGYAEDTQLHVRCLI